MEPAEGLPHDYVKTYQGANRDDAEYQFELDERRHALNGYVPTSREWFEEGWTGGASRRVLSGLFVWGGLWGQHKRRAQRAVMFGPPATLAVTYTLETALPFEDEPQAIGGDAQGVDPEPFEDWERYPAHQAEENVGYQKLAWYAAPFGSTGFALMVLAVAVNALRRMGRAAIRLLLR